MANERLPLDEDAVRGYLQGSIQAWRLVKINTGAATAAHIRAMHFVEATEAIYRTLFGEECP